jgi:hypothetical protein
VNAIKQGVIAGFGIAIGTLLYTGFSEHGVDPWRAAFVGVIAGAGVGLYHHLRAAANASKAADRRSS